MADNFDNQVSLPPGWDRKYDPRTGKYYYVNHFNKSTTWEDPRLRLRYGSQNSPYHGSSGSGLESIPLQHGSPDLRGYHVYPSTASHFPPQHAFQNPAPYTHTSIHFQDLTNVKPSPVAVRAISQRETPYSSPVRTTETSLKGDVEQAVARISATFPTASDTHIRALLLKYHNREAVVMSALQVEKHPLSTPGPYATPPQNRHIQNALQMTPPLGTRDSPSRVGSPILRPGSGGSGSFAGSPRIATARPHSSPKMKLRYLKSVFPKAEETLLLDVLSNSDNNVQKAAEKLISMGFEKRDTPPPRLTLKKKEEEQKVEEQKQAVPTPPPRVKSVEEKQKMKASLQEKYSAIPERVITIALDSADFDEDRAGQILSIMMQEESSSTKESSLDAQPAAANGEEESQVCDVSPPTPMEIRTLESSPCRRSPSPRKVEKSEKGPPKRSKGKQEVPKISRETSTIEESDYISPYILRACGPNKNYFKGPNDDLLLPEYITWNGPNPNMLNNFKRTLAKGPNKALLQERSYKAKGPNAELRKGPAKGLAKGSIYSHLTATPVEEESRGK